MLGHEFLDPGDELGLLQAVLADLAPLGQDRLQLLHLDLGEINRRVIIGFWVLQLANL